MDSEWISYMVVIDRQQALGEDEGRGLAQLHWATGKYDKREVNFTFIYFSFLQNRH